MSIYWKNTNKSNDYQKCKKISPNITFLSAANALKL